MQVKGAGGDEVWSISFRVAEMSERQEVRNRTLFEMAKTWELKTKI